MPGCSHNRDENKRLEFQAKGINSFLGNYEDTASLKLAMEGVDKVLLISAGDKATVCRNIGM